jgi:hypothetical protein
VRRNEGAGRTWRSFTLPLLETEVRSGETPPLDDSTVGRAAFFAALVIGCGNFFTFSLAVNSCRILETMASVSTL